MIVLGCDTATRSTSVALLGPGERIAELRDDPSPGERPHHATALLPLAADLLERHDLTWEALDLIAVGIGPGTFTGLRIGIATARALAQSAGAPLAGISSLRALAAAAAAAALKPGAPIAALIDAGRGEVFAAAWRGEQEQLEPCALAPQDVAKALLATGAGEPPAWLAVGDGALRFRPVLEAAGVAVARGGSGLHRVSAAMICRLAAAGHVDADEPVRPHYVRQPDAELTRPGS